MLLAVIVPFWTSYLLRVYAWQAILGETGALNQFLMQLGIIDKPSTLFVYNDLGVFVVLLYVYFPFAALALYAALEKFDFTQLNAAQDLGARPDQAFRHILIPQIRTGIITACIFVFIPILGEFLTPTLVGGAQGTLIANLIVNFTRQAQIPEGSALAILIAAFVTVLLIVFRNRCGSRTSSPVAKRMSRLDTMPVSPLAQQTRGCLGLLVGATLTFLYLPIAFLILFSFETSENPGFPITGLTLHWYQAMLSDTAIHAALLNSIEVALVVAVIATTIGTMVAFALVRGGLPFAGANRLLFTLPIMIPGVLLGIGLLVFITALGLKLGLHTVVAGHLVFTTPFIVLIVAARLQGFDRRLEWAAADLGASSRQTLRYIVLPLIAPAIFAGALLSITLSIDEFVVTFFTIGPQLTLPLYIYTQIKFGVTPEVNALATVILFGTLLVFGAGTVLLSRGRRLRRRTGG